jgi:D-alanine--(R)-lactate ligase
MARPRVAILFGGVSEEHDVSVRSAVEVAAAIDPLRYEPIYVGITRTGAWYLCDGPSAGWEHGDRRRAVISPDREAHGLLVEHDERWEVVPVDAAFPVLHGRCGEDGAVQGLLELSGIPYVGCDVQSSAVCMDKSLAHLVARSAGISTPAFVVLDGIDAPWPAELSYPVFVKPARSGSSFGVSKVDGPNQVDAALAAARQYDDKVVVERAVLGTEVGCAVLGNGAELIVGEVDQITLHDGFFRIHQEADPEHGSTNATVTVPADVPRAVREQVQEAARSIYRTLGCRGLARVDVFLQADGRIVLNEVNTMPGFTSYSRYPRMMDAAGVDLSAVVDRCLSLAMGR